MKDFHHLLLPYAYNILGSWDDAKDVVQDVMTSYLTTSKENIRNEKSYLIRSAINQAITVKNRKKKVVRAPNVLPEPIATEHADTNINLSDIVSYSLLVLLEQLNPKERAVFILKEAFNYSHEEIAEVLSSTTENSRKLLSRAKSKLKPSKATHTARGHIAESIINTYIDAIRSRDLAKLETLLSEEIVFVADGGSLPVYKPFCQGAEAVADLLILVYQKYQSAYTLVLSQVNHQPALLYYLEKELKVCQVLSFSETTATITRIDTIIDPEKLVHLWPDML